MKPKREQAEEQRAQSQPATQSNVPVKPAGNAWRPWIQIFTCMALFASVVVIGGWLSGGKSGAEKTIIRLVQPVGLLWLLFTGWCIPRWLQPIARCLRQRAIEASASANGSAMHAGHAAGIAMLWLVFMGLTTNPLSHWCMKRLESGVESYRPESGEPLDVVVVLGGGTHQGPWRAELSGAGDRVMYAAQLYLQGHARLLITTGDVSPGISRDATSPWEHTLELWSLLNIPESAMDTLHGQNTFQEIQSLKEKWPEFEHRRVGLLTSALHLPRAMRLAKAQQLDLFPIAADHIASDEPLTYLDFIPSAGPLSQLAACQHEIMAWLVNR
jgi:uncharacterized SAM-binding protein YcdF (DUF218 family)